MPLRHYSERCKADAEFSYIYFEALILNVREKRSQ